ncbi:DUF3319 domain-containing protein [Vibrio sonorensis]|uniref:DUF3319 domain-containing protein n=1 Tax=Vibrio sonorensis TaxID=1004316 RepID=UPI0008D99E6F|nr:DUF3319 domain-containing protein [Vibrio sonorensis]
MGKLSSSLMELFGIGANKAKKTNTVRTEFYRGHLLKRNIAHLENWSVDIADKCFVGKLEYIKMSVDQWCDNKVIVPPDYFEKNVKEHKENQTVEYKGFVIKNDTGKRNDWYATYRGRLMKGCRKKIEQAIDEIRERELAARD